MPEKYKWRKIRQVLKKIKMLLLVFAAATCIYINNSAVSAESCPDVKVVFARGSGGELNATDDFHEFVSKIAEKVPESLSVEYEDLAYPAVGVGIDNIWVSIGAFIGAGDSYTFGKSVDTGVAMLKNEITNSCAKTKFVLGGYSQGAMVVSKSLPDLPPEKIIYAATFGDPKIYLPEGEGAIPPACLNLWFSEYRMYVPDCMVYKGLLGAYKPYQPEGFSGKVGTWCNYTDIFCSTSYSINDHISYVAEGRYADAAETIGEKLLKYAAEVKNGAELGGKDVMIVFNANWKSETMLDEYKDAVKKRAAEELLHGNRVAIYLARTSSGYYAETTKVCGFLDCADFNVAEFFDTKLETSGYNIMKENGEWKIMNNVLGGARSAAGQEMWREEAEKTMVIYSKEDYVTGRPYFESDFKTDIEEMVPGIEIKRAEIVGFTPNTKTLAAKKVTLKNLAAPMAVKTLPTVAVTDIADFYDEVKIDFESTTGKTLVAINDTIVGITDGTFIVIRELDRSIENVLLLVPLDEALRGTGVEVIIPTATILPEEAEIGVIVPKVPNTGSR